MELAYTVENEPLRSRIEDLVGGENLVPHSENAAYAVDGKIPKVAALPQSVEDVSRLLEFANNNGLSMIPRGSGTKMHLGGTPRSVDMVLSLLHLNRIIEYAPDDLIVTVQAGAKLGDLQNTLAKKGQRLPLDPPYADATTIGGTVASNSSGPMRYRYGSCRDLILGLRVAAPSGEVTKTGGKVVKNVAGYDLKKLYIGSLGTLGVITEATFRLHPLPESEKTCLVSFKDVKTATDFSGRVLGSDLLPFAIEAVNHNAAAIVADEAGVKIGDSKYVIVLGFGDVDQSVTKQLSIVDELARSSGAYNCEVVEKGSHESVWNAIRNLPRSVNARVTRLIAFKVSVPISVAMETCKMLEDLAYAEGLECFISSHVGNGMVMLYLSEGVTSQTCNFLGLTSKARDLTSRIGGALIVERCPSDVKASLDVWDVPPSGVQLMRAIKSQFDPNGILSPGRFVGGI